MDAFLTQPAERQRVLYEKAGRRLGLSAGSIEKDLWVCWTLRALFRLPLSGSHLTFKGGTSLSKGWKLIERFSEDIDVVIDREFLGFRSADAPEQAASNKQRARRLELLMLACQRHIQETLRPSLQQEIQRLLPSTGSWRLESDADDPDGQTLLFRYPPTMRDTAYVRPVVKIELGARSDTEPSATPEIAPYLADVFADEVADARFSVCAVAPERTFWEKAALLHEETYREGAAAPKASFARHYYYYDLWCLITRGVAERAVADTGLFERVAAHRAVFFRRSREVRRRRSDQALFGSYPYRTPNVVVLGSATTTPCASRCSSARHRSSTRFSRSWAALRSGSMRPLEPSTTALPQSWHLTRDSIPRFGGGVHRALDGRVP